MGKRKSEKATSTMNKKPVRYEYRMRPSWEPHGWSDWLSCSEGHFNAIRWLSVVNGWHYEARSLIVLELVR